MDSYLDKIFAPKGMLSKVIPSYQPRGCQLELTAAVEKAFRTKNNLLAEAPTGTGKSLAYLVPAIYHATQHKKTVVIATANIALQEQLTTKDLPLLQSALPWEFEFQLIKGKNNFLCTDKLTLHQAAGGHLAELAGDDDGWQHDLKFNDIMLWAETTSTGDLTDLPFTPSKALWKQFSVAADECKGNNCNFRQGCFAYRSRDLAEDAQIIVTNYHQLFAHLAIKQQTDKDMILPPFDLVVCDEGHKAADIARDFFGFRITEKSIPWAARLLRGFGRGALLKNIERENKKFFHALNEHRQSYDYKCRLRSPHVVPVENLLKGLREAYSIHRSNIEECDNLDTRAELSRAAKQLQMLAEQLSETMSLEHPDRVYFLEWAPGDNTILRSKMITVDAQLQELLFKATDSVVVTSATLTSGKNFDFVKRELGTHDATTLTTESPFSFDTHTLLVTPTHLPEPNDREFPQGVANVVAEVIDRCAGGVLALFTSYKVLNAVHQHLSGNPTHTPTRSTFRRQKSSAHSSDSNRESGYDEAITTYNGLRLLKQGEMPRTKLVEIFRQDPNSILLGTESFWAGIDLPGQTLRCVIIDKLPFTPPDDPVLDALQELDRNTFRNHSLPRAVIAFKQGFGRLIRTVDDYGVVVALDRRLSSKGYGKTFLASLPPTKRTHELEAIDPFLQTFLQD